ncbi:TPA: hypothetical protein MCM48_005534, partial [Klebsiella pneumoniae]
GSKAGRGKLTPELYRSQKVTFLYSLALLAAEVNIKMVTNSHFFKGHQNLSGPKVTFMIAKTVFAWTKK